MITAFIIGIWFGTGVTLMALAILKAGGGDDEEY